jgi:hypothetical protein
MSLIPIPRRAYELALILTESLHHRKGTGPHSEHHKENRISLGTIRVCIDSNHPALAYLRGERPCTNSS